MGDEKAFENYWLELADTFIIGAATGGGMSGTVTAGSLVRNAQANNATRRLIDNSQYSSILEAFEGTDTEVTNDKIKTKNAISKVAISANVAIHAGAPGGGHLGHSSSSSSSSSII